MCVAHFCVGELATFTCNLILQTLYTTVDMGDECNDWLRMQRSSWFAIGREAHASLARVFGFLGHFSYSDDNDCGPILMKARLRIINKGDGHHVCQR